MKTKYHFIANAHLDPVWQWRVPEGLSLVKSTFRSALDRMKEYPSYTFTSACAAYYKWIKLSEPEMFEEIRERVKEGRWAVVGGMWVQPDCNLPSGEAFCRHFLYSQKFFKDNFGFHVKTGYNVDSFGHNGMLPQLLKKSGIDNYIYHRPDNRTEKTDVLAAWLTGARFHSEKLEEAWERVMFNVTLPNNTQKRFTQKTRTIRASP